MDYVSNMENANNFIVNSDIPKSDNNLLIKPSPKKLYNNLTSKKQNGHVTSSSGNMGDYMDSLHTEESKISKILENISSELRYNDNNNLNNTTLPISNKKSNKNNLIKSENLSEFNHLAASSGIVGKDFKIRDINKAKNITKFSNNKVNHKKRASNKLWNNQFQDKEKEKDKQKSNNNNTLNKTAYTSNNKNFIENNKPKADNLKRNRSKNMIENQNKQAKKEKHTKSMTNDEKNLLVLKILSDKIKCLIEKCKEKIYEIEEIKKLYEQYIRDNNQRYCNSIGSSGLTTNSNSSSYYGSGSDDDNYYIRNSLLLNNIQDETFCKDISQDLLTQLINIKNTLKVSSKEIENIFKYAFNSLKTSDGKKVKFKIELMQLEQFNKVILNDDLISTLLIQIKFVFSKYKEDYYNNR